MFGRVRPFQDVYHVVEQECGAGKAEGGGPHVSAVTPAALGPRHVKVPRALG